MRAATGFLRVGIGLLVGYLERKKGKAAPGGAAFGVYR